jgi:penicillin-binding protein 1A
VIRTLFRVILGLIIGLAGVVLAAGVAIALFTVSLLPELPAVESLRDVQLKVPLRVFAADGKLMAEYGEERREPVSIDSTPKQLVNAVLAAEDDSFYRHPGVDMTGVIRAALANLRSRGHEQGASTITMQVARNYFLSPEKTYVRKLKEVLLAFRIERALTKDQILDLYVNKIFLGNRAYGFGAAARVYYGRSLNELTLAQIAMLAGLPKAPSRDNPLANPDNAIKRRDYVLRRMHQLGHITDDEFLEASSAAITASKHIAKVDVQAPYVAEMARLHMLSRYGEEAYWRGFKVYTTIRPGLQRIADRALRKGLKRYDQRHGYRGPVSYYKLSDSTTVENMDRRLGKVPQSGEMLPAIVIAVKDKSAKLYTRNRQIIDLDWSGMSWAKRHINHNTVGPEPESAEDIIKLGDIVYVEKNDKEEWRLTQLPKIAGALVSLRPEDGAILALNGGFDFYLSKFNRAIQAQRQPGSNIKPFIYSAALEHGFTPATLVSGAPIVVPDSSDSTVWRPENYSGKFFGPTRLRKALSLSLNLVSVRIVRAIGIEPVLDHLTRFGFERSRLPNGLSLALGAGSISPLEVVRAYTVFANGGFRIEPYFIDWVEDRHGNVVEQANPAIICRACSRPPATDDTAEHLLRPRRAKRVLRADNHFLMTSMMRDVIRTGTGRRALTLGRTDLAGKTGTTNDFRDAWFSGFNSDVVTTAWVGFDDPVTLGRGEAGSRAALPIWIDYMRIALQGSQHRLSPVPDNIISRFVSTETGKSTLESDPQAYEEFFMAGTEPTPAVAGPLHLDGSASVGKPPAVPVPEGLF